MNKCYKGWDKEHNPHGVCCCNCKWQSKLSKHPWNNDKFKGSILEQVKDDKGNYMWVCTVQHGVAMSMDREHSMCEMHMPKGKGL